MRKCSRCKRTVKPIILAKEFVMCPKCGYTMEEVCNGHKTTRT